MKRITTLICIALLSMGLNAQGLLPKKYGIKIGVNIANIVSTPNDGVENIESSALLGVSGGFYIEIPLNDKWYINPEVVYVQKGALFNYDFIHDYDVNHRDEHNTTNELKVAYIELNPTVSYKTPSKISLNFGPSVSYLIQADYIPNETNTSEIASHELLEESIYIEESLDLGLNIGMSYYLTEDFLIDGKVNIGFMKIGEVSQEIYTGTIANESRSNVFELKNSDIMFSIAYLF